MSILAKVNPTTTVGTVIYTAPAGRKPLVNVNVANVSLADASFTLGLVQNTDKTILSIAVENGGNYASLPTLSINSGTAPTTPGTAAIATLGVLSATVVSQGAGYLVGDVLTVLGGTRATASTVTVATVDANGAALSVVVSQKGNYTVLPSSPVNATMSPFGSGATFTLNWELLSVTVSAGGNGYNPSNVVISTTGGGVVTPATFTAQYGTVFEVATDTYHPITVLNASGVIERTGVTLSAGDSIVAVSTVPGALNFIVLGYEDLA